MQSTTIGSKITSFIPLSSRSASRADVGRTGFRMSERSSTGSVEASAAPRMAAAAGWRPSSSQAASAVRAAGSSVPGPRIRAASRRCWRISPMSTPMASVKSTSSRPRVAMTWSDGESRERSTRPRPAGPSAAPSSRKIETCGSPERSTAPDISEERMMTMPIRASRALKLSWVMARNMTPDRRLAPAGIGRTQEAGRCQEYVLAYSETEVWRVLYGGTGDQVRLPHYALPCLPRRVSCRVQGCT